MYLSEALMALSGNSSDSILGYWTPLLSLFFSRNLFLVLKPKFMRLGERVVENKAGTPGRGSRKLWKSLEKTKEMVALFRESMAS